MKQGKKILHRIFILGETVGDLLVIKAFWHECSFSKQATKTFLLKLGTKTPFI